MPTDSRSRDTSTGPAAAPRRILLCSSDIAKLDPLHTELTRHGLTPLRATHGRAARALIAAEPVSAVLLDLLLADGDGISLAWELRKTYPWMPVLVLSTESPAPVTDGSALAWLSRATGKARLIFALKQATRVWDGEPPSILFVEDDDQTAQLIQSTLAERARLFRARSVLEARIALSLRDYDFAVVNSAQVMPNPNDHRALSGKPLAIDGGTAISMLIEHLRKPQPLPETPAIC